MAGRHAEVGIVGAGPAGARLAELLGGRRVDVLMWDPRAPWEKPCGGGLTAALLKERPEFAPVVPRAQPVTRIGMRTDGGAGVEVELTTPIHMIARAELASCQLALAEAAGAVLEHRAVRGLARTHGGWTVRLDDGSERRVRCLVGADGAASLVRTVVRPDLRPELAPTRVAFVPGRNASPDVAMTRVRRGTGGYSWDFQRLDHRSVGAMGFPGQTTRAGLEAEARQWLETGTRDLVWTGAVIATARHGLAPGYPEIGGPDFVLLGDAAGLADPATGEGIANALRSAEAAAEAFERDHDFRGYPALAERRLEPGFRLARRLRALLYDQGLGTRVVEAAARHRPIRALLQRLLNAVNEHRAASLAGWIQVLRATPLPRTLA